MSPGPPYTSTGKLRRRALYIQACDVDKNFEYLVDPRYLVVAQLTAAGWMYHSYLGHNYVAHNYLGHNYLARATPPLKTSSSRRF